MLKFGRVAAAVVIGCVIVLALELVALAAYGLYAVMS